MTSLRSAFGDRNDGLRVMAAARAFRDVQVWRARVRVLLIQAALISAVFWTVALAIGAHLVEAGLGFVAAVGLVLWTGFTAPALLLQGVIILDLVSYTITRRTFMAPYLWSAAEGPEGAPNRPDSRKRPVAGRVANSLSRTSPLAAPSLWCLLVLFRTPRERWAWDPTEHPTAGPSAGEVVGLPIRPAGRRTAPPNDRVLVGI